MTECRCHSHNGFVLGEPRSLEGLSIARAEEKGLTPDVDCVRLDLVGSVSGLRRDETDHVFDDEIVDNQYRRFLNGS